MRPRNDIIAIRRMCKSEFTWPRPGNDRAGSPGDLAFIQGYPFVMGMEKAVKFGMDGIAFDFMGNCRGVHWIFAPKSSESHSEQAEKFIHISSDFYRIDCLGETG